MSRIHDFLAVLSSMQLNNFLNDCMKLLYINNNRIPTEEAGGAQEMEMCGAFARSGLDVKMLVPNVFNSIKQNPFQYYGVKENFKIKKVFCLNSVFLDKYAPRIFFYAKAISFAFASLFYAKDQDILYARDKFAIFALRLIRKDFFIEVHSLPPSIFLPSYRKAKGIITTTKRLKLILLQKGFPGSSIMVAYNGVDLDKFNVQLTKKECRKRLNLPEDKNIVLYSGHLRKWKGAHILARASFYIKTKNTEIYFIGGREQEVERFKLDVKDLLLSKIIGHRPHFEIPFWLKAADVLVLPNSSQKGDSVYENSVPLKLFEYMASKTPIVSSSLPPIMEILNNENSILVRPDEPEALAFGIDYALENEDFSQKVSQKAFQDIQSFLWENRAKKILEFFHNAQTK